MIKNDKQFNIFYLLWISLRENPNLSFDLNNYCSFLENELKDYLMCYGYSFNQEKLFDINKFNELYEKGKIL